MNLESFLILASTGFPACTNRMTLRGRFNFLMKSSGLKAPVIGNFPSASALLTVESTFCGDLFPTQTSNPWDAILSAKFCPITDSP